MLIGSFVFQWLEQLKPPKFFPWRECSAGTLVSTQFPADLVCGNPRNQITNLEMLIGSFVFQWLEQLKPPKFFPWRECSAGTLVSTQFPADLVCGNVEQQITTSKNANGLIRVAMA